VIAGSDSARASVVTVSSLRRIENAPHGVWGKPMVPSFLSARVYHCPGCRSQIALPEFDEERAICPGCGTAISVTAKYVSLAVCLIVLVSYACSFAVVYWLTHDVRRFMLPGLESACILLVLSVCFLFPRLPRTVKPGMTPHQLSDSCRREAA
jgi:hypothetical protein